VPEIVPEENSMKLMIRTNEASVGVKILDCDHREMSDTIDEILGGAGRDVDRSHMASLLRRLAHFSISHFALEEGMMGATLYPGMRTHCLHHQRIMERLSGLIARYDRTRFILDPNSLTFLSESHTTHVHDHDLLYGEWLNKTAIHSPSNDNWTRPSQQFILASDVIV
jgi:hemerythrin-like metal-binding protein